MVSIITVNYNQTQVTLDLLKSLALQDYQDLEIIVVDNGSKELVQHEVSKTYPWVKVIRSEKNLGFAGGNNLGIRAAQGDYLFFVNNDTVIPENTIRRMVSYLDKNKEVGMLSPMIYYFDKKDTLQYAGSTEVNTITGRNESIGFHQQWRLEDRYVETAYPHGAAMMIPRRVIDEVGEMPENFFLYYEELDWCSKIKNLGYKAQVDYGGYILHKESVSTGKLSSLKTYFITRNRILFMRRNVKLLRRMVFLLFFILVALPKNIFMHLLKGERELAKAFLAGVSWHFIHNRNSKVLGYKFNDLNA